MADLPDQLASGARPPRPIIELLELAVPVVAQMASYTAMQFIDMLMLSRLGDAPAAAASNAGMVTISVLAFGMGMMTIVNTLASQAFGRREFGHCGRYLWQGIWVALAYSLLAMMLVPLAGPIFGMFHHPANLVAMESRYFYITVLATFVKLAAMALGQFMLAINRPGAVLLAAVLGVSVNAGAAWCLVLGHVGFHSHGIAGAAWAQNIGTTTELLLLIAMACQKSIRAYGLADFRPRRASLKLLLSIGLPAGLQFIGDIFAWTLFINLVMGLLGEVAMSANTYMMRYMMVSFMPAVGISTAVTALVGRYIGRGQPDIAMRRAYLGFTVSTIYMLFCGIGFYSFRHQLISLFSHDPQVQRVGAIYLIYAAVYEPFDSMYIIFVGALRGAGDTLVPAVMVATLCFTLCVGGGVYVAKYVPQLGYGGPWMAATLYGIISGVFLLVRFARGRWKNINLQEAPNGLVAA